jgi:hypothetical protein
VIDFKSIVYDAEAIYKYLGCGKDFLVGAKIKTLLGLLHPSNEGAGDPHPP